MSSVGTRGESDDNRSPGQAIHSYKEPPSDRLTHRSFCIIPPRETSPAWCRAGWLWPGLREPRAGECILSFVVPIVAIASMVVGARAG